ncbi:MAG: alpha/beta fold hydrolase [Xanthobacteraceae bacterium]|nr:alpha/beta fold hydrolase [Xanthobacteraceae bacterium]
MKTKGFSNDAVLDACRVAFGMTDTLRRAQGQTFEAFGLGPQECPYEVMATGAFWRLRDYCKHGHSQSVLIVAAPIKRAYIWDLAPSVSALRYILEQGFHVYLLEWLPAETTGENGLAEYADSISECVAMISSRRAGAKPFLMGHSLGGTLAATFAASESESICGLVLLGAPLCFKPETSRFRDALVSLIPAGLLNAGPCPGSLLSHVSVLASPDTFIWSRIADAVLSSADNHAWEIHARVERWALDEAALSGELVRQMIEWFYRENRFFHGQLKIANNLVGPVTLKAPTLAAVNIADDVAPLGSVKPFIDAMPIRDVRIVEVPGERGVCLQHLGILIGREARAVVWPEIISWMDSHADPRAPAPRAPGERCQ